MLKPVLFTEDFTEEYSKDTLGLKGFNLFKLKKDGFKVPYTFVYDYDTLNSSFNSIKEKELEIELPAGSLPQLMAVRSSGSVSMPGLMDTKLNVPLEGLKSAIIDVYNSYKPYFYSVKLAIVVQEMVNATYSGISFSGDFNGFKPIIHYVNGTGETLVGGSVNPKDLITSNEIPLNVKNSVYSLTKKIHNLYGPSDIEWVVDINDVVYIVQVRPIKSFSLFKEIKDTWIPPKDIFTHITKGQAIGSKKWSATYSEYVTKLTSMDPKEVDKISGCVLTTVGGDTSHAALLSRSKNIPAIKVETMPDLKDYMYVLVSPEGNIYGSNSFKALKTKLPSTISVKENKYKLQPGTWAPIPLLYLNEKLLSLTNLILYFYNKIGDPTYTGYDAAKLISTYCYFACIGEMRHCRNKSLIDKWCSLLDLQVADLNKESRDYANTSSISNKHLDLEQIINIVETMISIFSTKGAFQKAYGGRKWAKIAKLLLSFITGKISAILFVDKCLQIQHNCGSLFNKFSFLYAEYVPVNALLNARQKSYDQLYQAALEYADTQIINKYCKELCFKDEFIFISSPYSKKQGSLLIHSFLEAPPEHKVKKKKCLNTEPINGMMTDIEMSMTQ